MTGAGRIQVIALTLVAAGVALAAGEPGTLDTGFGTDGVASIAVPYEPGVYSTVYRDAIRQSSGRIVLAGNEVGVGGTVRCAWYAAAIDASGAPDPSFGSGGVVTLFANATNGLVLDATVDGEDRILLCGFLHLPTTQGKKTTTIGGLAIARLTASGALDTSFGDGGLVLDTLGDVRGVSTPTAYRVIVQSDGKVVVTGRVTKSRRGYAWLVARYSASGQRDSSFGSGGIVIDDLTAGQDVPDGGLAVDASGRLLVGGSCDSSGTSGSEDHWVIARYTATGALDASFGSGGRITGEGRALRFLAVDQQDRVLGCGFVPGSPPGPGADDGVVTRYTTAGARDASFGSGGVFTDGWVNFFFEMVVESSGDVLLTGYRDGEQPGIRSITRVLEDGMLDAGFGTDGHAEGPVASESGMRCPVILAPTTVAFSMAPQNGTYGSPWYVTQFHR